MAIWSALSSHRDPKESLQKQSIPLSNCHGQAYDTSVSISYNQVGVYEENVKDAPS